MPKVKYNRDYHAFYKHDFKLEGAQKLAQAVLEQYEKDKEDALTKIKDQWENTVNQFFNSECSKYNFKNAYLNFYSACRDFDSLMSIKKNDMLEFFEDLAN